jgi:hypothetical protein
LYLLSRFGAVFFRPRHDPLFDPVTSDTLLENLADEPRMPEGVNQGTLLPFAVHRTES